MPVVVRGTRIGRLPLLAVAPAFPISPELQARGLFRYNTSERQVFTLEGERESTDAVIKLNGWPHMTRVEEIRYEPTFSSIFYFQYLFSDHCIFILFMHVCIKNDEATKLYMKIFFLFDHGYFFCDFFYHGYLHTLNGLQTVK